MATFKCLKTSCEHHNEELDDCSQEEAGMLFDEHGWMYCNDFSEEG